MRRTPRVDHSEEERLFSGVLWLNAKVLGLTLGIVCGLGLFVATNWLVLKGGDQVGPHLRLLANYFIGYRVSFLGSIVGLLYGVALGTLIGAAVGWIYNVVARFRNGPRRAP